MIVSDAGVEEDEGDEEEEYSRLRVVGAIVNSGDKTRNDGGSYEDKRTQ